MNDLHNSRESSPTFGTSESAISSWALEAFRHSLGVPRRLDAHEIADIAPVVHHRGDVVVGRGGSRGIFSCCPGTNELARRVPNIPNWLIGTPSLSRSHSGCGSRGVTDDRMQDPDEHRRASSHTAGPHRARLGGVRPQATGLQESAERRSSGVRTGQRERLLRRSPRPYPLNVIIPKYGYSSLP